MKRLLRLSMLLLLLGATAALAQDVRYNFDKSTDFSKYKTYQFVPIKGAAQVNDLVDKQIKAALESQLSQKGLTKVDSDTADLYIGYQTAIGQEKEFTSYNSGWGYGPGWGRGGWYGPSSSMTTGQTSTIYTGQIAIDMYDSAQKDLVWRGVVSKTIDTKAKPDKQEKNLNKALTKLFKKYPPEAKP
jgi:Domain of unknown function (DUF4136)